MRSPASVAKAPAPATAAPPRKHARGVQLSLLCLVILGLLPVIGGARRGDESALAFAFWLSFWQLLAVPAYLLGQRQDQTA